MAFLNYFCQYLSFLKDIYHFFQQILPGRKVWVLRLVNAVTIKLKVFMLNFSMSRLSCVISCDGCVV